MMNVNTNTAIFMEQITAPASMSSLRKTSLAAGILYLLTFVSVPTLVLYGPIHQPDYLLNSDSDTGVIIGGILEIIVALTGIATAVVLYPVLRAKNNMAALGLVASRVLEAATIFLGVAFLLTVVSLHKDGANSDVLQVSRALVALYDRIFILGQGFIPAIDDLLLGFLLYKSRLVPRRLSLIGMIGAFPLFAGYLGVTFGIIDRFSPFAGLSAVMVAVFEFSLGIYLIVKGFRTSPTTATL